MRKGFEAKFADHWKQACIDAKFKRGYSYAEIAKMAKAGTLVPGEPFTISKEYVGDLCRADERRRLGKTKNELADMPGNDAIAVLKRRLIIIADEELRALGRQKQGKRDLARFRDAARALKEAQAIPDAKDGPRPAPGQRDPQHGGRRTEGATRSGQTGALLKAMAETLPFPRESEQDTERETTAV